MAVVDQVIILVIVKVLMVNGMTAMMTLFREPKAVLIESLNNRHIFFSIKKGSQNLS